MKRWIAVFLALAMMVPLATAAAAEETIQITVFNYMLQATKQDGLKAVEDAYIAGHPNVTFVNKMYNAGVDYFPQLSTELAGGSNPEIIMGNCGQYPSLVEEGFILDLTDNEAIKSMNLSPGVLGDVSVNGHIYGFPIDFKTWGVFYNKDIFAKLGIEVPATQSALLDACAKIKAAGIDPWVRSHADAVFGDMEMRNTVWPRAKDAGQLDVFEKLMSGEGKFQDYPFFAEGLKVWQQRMQWNRPDDMSNSQDKCLEVFASGGAAMMYTGTWNVGDLLAKKPAFEFGFFTAPIDEDPASPMMNLQVDQCFMINQKAANWEAALDFMEFWMSQGVAWSEITQMPLNTGAVSDKLLPLVKQLVEAKATGDVVHYGDFTRPFNSEYITAYRKTLTAFAESCLTGGTMTIDQCIENLQKAFDEVRMTSM